MKTLTQTEVAFLWDSYRLAKSQPEASTNWCRNQLAEHYMYLVTRLARNLVRGLSDKVDEDDLVQAGAVGLMDAIEKYENGRNCSFDTYAGFRIMGAMKDELRGIDPASRLQRVAVRQMEDAMESCKQSLGRVPDRAEIAAHLGMTEEEFEKFESLATVPPVIAINKVRGYDGLERSRTAKRTEPVEPGPLSDIVNSDLVSHLLASLPKEDRDIVTAYYLEGKKMQAIADSIGLTESRVSQRVRDIVRRLQARYADHLRAIGEKN